MQKEHNQIKQFKKQEFKLLFFEAVSETLLAVQTNNKEITEAK